MRSKTEISEKIKSALFGVAVGDALGVPVEFMSRDSLVNNPVKGMQGYGTYNVPPGTWSDDSSLTFCLAEALSDDFSLESVASNFIAWYEKGLWTPYGNVFDVGIATAQAIRRLKSGVQPELAGGSDENSNGNGSLMRILPLVFHVKDLSPDERFGMVKRVSSITHAHPRSVIACFYYLEFAKRLLEKQDKFEIYRDLKVEVSKFLKNQEVADEEISNFSRLLENDIFEQSEDSIKSTGYVVYSLEAGIWCLLNTDNYRDAVLKAVNLGGDTDTIAAITGGLAGILYGHEAIPRDWLLEIARKEEIEDLSMRMAEKYCEF